ANRRERDAYRAALQELISTFQRSIGSVWQRRRIGSRLQPIRIQHPFFPPASCAGRSELSRRPRHSCGRSVGGSVEPAAVCGPLRAFGTQLLCEAGWRRPGSGPDCSRAPGMTLVRLEANMTELMRLDRGAAKLVILGRDTAFHDDYEFKFIIQGRQMTAADVEQLSAIIRCLPGTTEQQAAILMLFAEAL